MKRLPDKNAVTGIFVILFFFLSCNKGVVFSEFQSVPERMWDKQSEFIFQFDLNDVSIPYNISLQLRNNAFYLYQNLWIYYEELHLDDIMVKDTIEYRLAAESGKWTGNGVTLFQNKFPIRAGYQYPDTGNYTIRIRHAMRDDQLKGIENIGLLIEKAKP